MWFVLQQAINHDQLMSEVRSLLMDWDTLRDQYEELAKASDLLIHTSLREGMARVLPQALLVGVPVISYDIDGAREVIEHERTGVLLQPGDIDGLARWWVRLLGDSQEAHSLASAGQRLCATRFRAEGMVDALVHAYCELLRGGV